MRTPCFAKPRTGPHSPHLRQLGLGDETPTRWVARNWLPFPLVWQASARFANFWFGSLLRILSMILSIVSTPFYPVEGTLSNLVARPDAMTIVRPFHFVGLPRICLRAFLFILISGHYQCEWNSAQGICFAFPCSRPLLPKSRNVVAPCPPPSKAT